MFFSSGQQDRALSIAEILLPPGFCYEHTVSTGDEETIVACATNTADLTVTTEDGNVRILPPGTEKTFSLDTDGDGFGAWDLAQQSYGQGIRKGSNQDPDRRRINTNYALH